MKKLRVEHFVRHLKQTIHQEGSFAFFLGAGCSISSGVPTAKDLVDQWLPRLHDQMTGGEVPFDEWVSRELPVYDQGNQAAAYAPVMRSLFLLAAQRQREIERIVSGRDPGFGYAVLAKLITHPVVGPRCNLVLTTNFDDMVADALYLYTQHKPLVIVHESLAGFVETGLTRPLVMKLHGDALLEPKNTEEETSTFGPEIEAVLTEQLRNRGLIFVGYGGNDRSLVRFLQKLPADALRWGVYWIHDHVPENDFGEWMTTHPNAFWIDHLRFDELMLLVREQFELGHPEDGRFEKLLQTYRDTFAGLSNEIEDKPEGETKGALTAAASKAAEEFKDWWAVELAARRYKESSPEEADGVYQSGLERFPHSGPLIGSYALFLSDVLHDMERAEEFYQRAIEADSTTAINLGNYAIFLKNVRRDKERAEEFYVLAIEADPTDADYLGSYAIFLERDRHDVERAEEFYVRAIEAGPNHAINLGNYGGFLLARGETTTGLSHIRRAIESADPARQRPLILECQYYIYANCPAEDRDASLKAAKELLDSGVRSPGWDFSANIDRARDDGHPNVPLLEALARAINEDEDVSTLGAFDEWRALDEEQATVSRSATDGG